MRIVRLKKVQCCSILPAVTVIPAPAVIRPLAVKAEVVVGPGYSDVKGKCVYNSCEIFESQYLSIQ